VTYGLNTTLLEGDPVEFAQALADPDRMAHAEQEIPAARKRNAKKRLSVVEPPNVEDA